MASRVSVYRQTLCVYAMYCERCWRAVQCCVHRRPASRLSVCCVNHPPAPVGKCGSKASGRCHVKQGRGLTMSAVRSSAQVSTGQHRDADDGRAGETAFGTTSCLYIYWCWCSFNNLLSLLEHKAVRVCGMKHFLKGYRSNCIVPKTSGPARRGAALRGMRGMRSSVAQYCGRYQLYLGWK